MITVRNYNHDVTILILTKLCQENTHDSCNSVPTIFISGHGFIIIEALPVVRAFLRSKSILSLFNVDHGSLVNTDMHIHSVAPNFSISSCTGIKDLIISTYQLIGTLNYSFVC